LHAKAGDAILTKFMALFGEPKFPSPDRILAADFDSLRNLRILREEDRDDSRDRIGLAEWFGPRTEICGQDV